jgi:ribosomal protein S18 acetylase RimI-like enzyme
LGAEHVAQCLVLSQAANWNQNESDWQLMLSLGHGWGISVDGQLVASTLVIPFGSFAWISMVLVLPEHRRKGHASRLLRIALDDLKGSKLKPVLDATPDGREVYRQEGFADTWTFKRFALTASRPAVNGRGGKPINWRKALELDAEAFGGDREWMLRALQKRLPRCAVGMSHGFVLGREGREANQIGPLVARDESTALALLEHALSEASAPLYVDVVDHAPRVQMWLLERGFVIQRPFTRMVHGGGRAPGDEKLVYLVAGPELG